MPQNIFLANCKIKLFYQSLAKITPCLFVRHPIFFLKFFRTAKLKYCKNEFEVQPQNTIFGKKYAKLKWLQNSYAIKYISKVFLVSKTGNIHHYVCKQYDKLENKKKTEELRSSVPPHIYPVSHLTCYTVFFPNSSIQFEDLGFLFQNKFFIIALFFAYSGSKFCVTAICNWSEMLRND